MSSEAAVPHGIPEREAPPGAAVQEAEAGVAIAASETSHAYPAAAAAPTANEALGNLDGGPELTVEHLLNRISEQRNQKIELELQIVELRAANRTLQQQLQDHARANLLATQQIAGLNERVLALTRVINSTLNQLVGVQRELIETQRERLDELQERLNEVE